MRSQTSLSLGSLVLLAAMPLAWLACGGGKPPETPADESSSSSDNSDTSSASSASPSDSSAPASSAASDTSSDNSSGSEAPAASSAAAAPAAPPAPAFGDSDCGKCVDKTCAKPLAACGKNSDCQAAVDAIHSCGSDKGASACIGSGSAPSGAKPKKAFNAYTKCATKATTGKACKASCQ